MKGNFRDALLKFRDGVFWVQMRKFRFTPGSDFSCPFCPDQEEDEIHVLCECAEYDNIRPDLLWRESVPMRSVY